MEHILHCDLDSVKQFINDLEQEKSLKIFFFGIIYMVIFSKIQIWIKLKKN